MAAIPLEIEVAALEPEGDKDLGNSKLLRHGVIEDTTGKRVRLFAVQLQHLDRSENLEVKTAVQPKRAKPRSPH